VGFGDDFEDAIVFVAIRVRVSVEAVAWTDLDVVEDIVCAEVVVESAVDVLCDEVVICAEELDAELARERAETKLVREEEE